MVKQDGSSFGQLSLMLYLVFVDSVLVQLDPSGSLPSTVGSLNTTAVHILLISLLVIQKLQAFAPKLAQFRRLQVCLEATWISDLPWRGR